MPRSSSPPSPTGGRTGEAGEKIKKAAGKGPPRLAMVENPDILAGIGHHGQRPYLVVGFAAETENLLDNAAAKLKKKGADFIVANDVSAPKPASWAATATASASSRRPASTNGRSSPRTKSRRGLPR